MENNHELTVLKKSLFDEGYLGAQFDKLEDMQDDSEPNFQEEIVNLFFTDNAKHIQDIQQTLSESPIDFAKLDGMFHKLKGSSLNIGAEKLKDACIQAREDCDAKNEEGTKATFKQLKEDYDTLKEKLDSYFQLMKQDNPTETDTDTDNEGIKK